MCIVSSSVQSKSHSNTLDIMGKRLIGLYELASVGGFLGLAIIIIHWKVHGNIDKGCVEV